MTQVEWEEIERARKVARAISEWAVHAFRQRYPRTRNLDQATVLREINRIVERREARA